MGRASTPYVFHPQISEQYISIINNNKALFVNVTAEELREMNVDPQHQLQLFNGGFIASLEVYHHLHCIVSSPRLSLLISMCACQRQFSNS